MIAVEEITFQGKIFAYIISKRRKLPKTTFITPHESNLQVGFVVYKSDQSIPRHIHKKIIRHIDRTEEVLVIEQGSCIIDLYADKKTKIASRKLVKGDIVILIEAGHGFRMLQNTRLLEIKQGPYTGLVEKERF